MSKANYQSCHFSGIFYPESQPLEDFKNKVKSSGLQCAISPIHDKDTYLATDEIADEIKIGDLKKAHYHFYVLFPTRHTSRGAKKILEENLNLVVPVLDVTFDSRYIFRYFVHMDDLRKYQYDIHDIVTINGCILDFTLPVPKDVQQISDNNEILNTLLSNNHISTFKDLVVLYLDNPNMIEYIRKNAYFVKCLLGL